MSPHLDPEQLLKTFIDFAQAESWSQSKRVLEQHPELLSDDVDTLLGQLAQLAATQEDKGNRDLVEEYRALLQHCRTMGVERAFAEKEPASQPTIPAEFDEDLRHAQEAEQHYQRTGQRDALDAAIDVWGRILTRPAFSETAEWFQLAVFNSAGGTYLTRYWAKGELPDLDRSLALCRQAVSATPPDAPERATLLTNLGTGLSDRYGCSGQLADLEAAIEAFEQAVAATPPDAPERAMFLSNLGAGLNARYRRSGQLADLEAAINAYEQAVAGTPPDAPERATLLNNLGLGLSNRYGRSGQLVDLEAAIEAFEQAVAATPPDAPERARNLNNLGTGFSNRYGRSGQLADLEAAIEAFEQAVAATPPDSPERAGPLNNLGAGLSDRYGRSGQFADLEAAQSAYRGACNFGLETALEPALMGARSWGGWALERHAWEEAAEAYDYGAKAIERLLEAQLLRSAKETWLREVQGVAANAAYALARTGDLERAVEIVEGGRARLLAEALERNRHDLEQLPARGYAALLARYRQAATHWEALTTGAELPSEPSLPGNLGRRAALAAARAELDGVVEAVRQVPGYEDFLRAPTFAQIRAAAQGAPLVYLMATPAGGLALIVPPAAKDSNTSSASGVQALWLDALTAATVRDKIRGGDEPEQRGGYLQAYARWRAEPRNPETRTQWFDTVETTTRWLWETLLGPLMAALAPVPVTGDEVSPESPIPEVVLIPTGLLGLLPLHAAWTDDAAARTGRRYALDVAALRYAPNARALTAAQALADKTSTERLLLCVEPQPVSANPLPAAKREALDILRYWSQESYTDRWHVTATHKELMTQLPEHTCLHFAGHAFAGWTEPRQGGLLMASDQVLSVGELTDMHLAMRLAVLSACESGVPGTRLPDEVIGLPTALMEAGVAGVVASFWSVADESTAQLMAHFHRLWRGQPSDTGTQEAISEPRLAPSEALRRAQIELRDAGYAHPFYWGAFAYTGR